MESSPIVHVEIVSSDPKAAGKFYSDLFGWKIEVDESFNYVQFMVEPGPGGAFPAMDDQTGFKRPMVVPYVHSHDIDADLKKAESLGGTVQVPKTEIPMTGWFALFADPTGNTIGLYTSAREGG